MTSHDTALEAARSAIRAAAFRDPMADISSLAEVVLSAYISTLSPDVSGLVERLDNMLEHIGRDHRTGYEFILRYTSQDQVDVMRLSADALTAISLQLAAVEERAERLLHDLSGERSLVAASTEANKQLRASLTLAQEENERLRRALEALSASIFAPNDKRSPELEAAIQMTIDALSTPSKEDKP